MKTALTTLFALAVATAAGGLQAQEIQGQASAGAQKVAMCIGCHGIAGYQSSFPQVHKVPMISGQGAAYITAALTAYKKGERKHPTMRSIAGSLSEQDMADIAAYYAALGSGVAIPEQPARQPDVQVGALLEKGACVSCHGVNFAKPIDPSYPKIAGQYPDYLFVALKSYKLDHSAYVGRNNGIMAGISKQFTQTELQALAQYVGSLQGDLQVTPQSRFK